MSDNNTVLVKIKNVYGTDKVYPACDTAKRFCAIARQNTITQNTWDNIEALGYTIEVITSKNYPFA